MSSSITASHRRRNGRQLACEACRKRKLACDHVLPVCGRCRRRNGAGGCVYLISPTTTRAYESRGPPAVAQHTPSLPIPSTQYSAGYATYDTTQSNAETSPGFLGATSFQAVLSETQSNIAYFQRPSDHSASQTASQDASPNGIFEGRERSSMAGLPSEALEVLSAIPDEDSERILFSRYNNPNDGWIRLAARRLADSIWTHFKPYLVDRSNTSGLLEFARIISSNSSKGLSEEYEDPDEWLASFSGPLLRWEALGILFTYWAFGAQSSRDKDDVIGSLRPQGMSRKQAVGMFKECAASCISMCARSSSSNTLLLYLLYKHMLLQSNVTGDSSVAVWRQIADTVALATFLGIHHGPSTGISISSEVKRRVFGQVFIIDKVVATFNGRPPLISRRYDSTPLPLDVNDETLLSSHAELLETINNLDSNGWNTQGALHSATILRARKLLANARDGILEIVLGNHDMAPLHDLLHLKTQETSTFEQLPPALKYHPVDLRDVKTTPPLLYAKLLVTLEHLQNTFFIERLLLKSGHQDAHADLLSTSMEMTSLTLIFWTHRDSLTGLHGDFEWLVMSYAAPASGILCNELLQPSSQQNGEKVSRSSIVQQLSLLVGFLDWVSPEAPNGDLCGSVKGVIGNVLDRTINTGGQGVETMDVNWEFDPGMELPDFGSFELLDTFEWLRGGEVEG